MTPLLSWSFWFGMQTLPLSPMMNYILLGLIALAFVGAIAVKMQRPRLTDKLEKKVAARVLTCLLSVGCSGLVLYLIAWQRIPFLGMRIFWLVWLSAHLIWGYCIWSRASRDIPAMKRARAERAAYEKWLPKAKK